MKKKLKSGYTTGACAAAAAKAAAILLLRAEVQKRKSIKEKKNRKTLGNNFKTSGLSSPQPEEVEIPFPNGGRHKFKIQDSKFKIQGSENIAVASVIKDAGDDPDVTHGAEIKADVRVKSSESGGKRKKNDNNSKLVTLNSSLIIKGGKGVGVVTKPGLPVSVGEPAINPVPRQMIKEAVKESLEFGVKSLEKKQIRPDSKLKTHNSELVLEITISVPNGEELAKKTLNYRLGIIGGISILGTTGIVKPVSAEAWTATISSSMDVAKAMGHKEIVLSAGKASEKAHIKKYNFQEESYVLMGDYLEFSLLEAQKHGFRKIHLCAQWAKMLKIAMATPQTHVKFGAINIKKVVEFLNFLDIRIPRKQKFNTAREIFEYIHSEQIHVVAYGDTPLQKVCNAAKKYVATIANGVPLTCYLVSYGGEVITRSE